MWSRIAARVCRKKLLDGEQLLHSEWNRRLGAFSLAGIGGVLSLGTTLFVLLPGILSSGSLAPPLPSLFIGLFIQFFVAKQLSSVARILPRNCLLYELAYATHSEALAFVIGWSQLVDSVCFIAVLGRALADHIRLLFTSAVHKNLVSAGAESFKPSIYPFFQTPTPSPEWTLSPDYLTLLVVFVSALILCCSLRVLATITIVFLISALFTVTSTTVVAILHNMQQMRVTSLGFPYEYDQISTELQFLLIGVLCLESFSHISEETEQPRKILPRFYPLLSKATAALLLVSMVAFFPFTRKINFHESLMLPDVFNSISIYSARYLMSVGAVCSLTGALLCSFLPPSRILCSMTRDGLLPLPLSLFKLYGKGGSPRSSVLLTLIAVLFLTLLPKKLLILFLPINICLRIFYQSLLLYQICYSSDKIGLSKIAPKYNRLKTDRAAVDAAATVDGYSCISSDDDPDDEIISHLCELHNRQNAEWSNILDQASQTGYQNYVEIDTNGNTCQVHQNPPGTHNCFQASCGDLQIDANDVKARQYHIYETEFENSPFCTHKSDGQGKEPFLNPEGAMRTAMGYLVGFVVSSVLSAVSYMGIRETHGFTPVLPLITLICSLIFAVFFLIQAMRLRATTDERQTPLLLPLLSLILVFFSLHIMFSFQLIQFIALMLCVGIGAIIYFISMCCQSNCHD